MGDGRLAATGGAVIARLLMKFTDSSGVASITGAIETVQERWLGVRDRPGLLPSDQKLFRLTRLHQSVRRQQGRCVRVDHGRRDPPSRGRP